MDWTVDWTLDSISGLEFRSPGVKGHLHMVTKGCPHCRNRSQYQGPVHTGALWLISLQNNPLIWYCVPEWSLLCPASPINISLAYSECKVPLFHWPLLCGVKNVPWHISVFISYTIHYLGNVLLQLYHCVLYLVLYTTLLQSLGMMLTVEV